jgi:hypothetical protein
VAGSFEQFRSVQGVRKTGADLIEVDFGGGIRALHPGTRVLDLRPDTRGIVPVDGPVRWEALDELPHLLTVEWAGPARGIVEAVGARAGIEFLYWSDARGDVDLSATRLVSVRLDGPELRSVRLPASVRQLSLGRVPAAFGADPRTATIGAALQVEAPNEGHQLDLRLFGYGADVVIPEGVRRASTLWLWVGGEVSAAVLCGLTDLEKLHITFDRAPGKVDHLSELGRHVNLRSLEFGDAYGLSVADLPDLPALGSLELHGTRRATAAAAKARYGGGRVKLCVSGAKTDKWLAVHMDNPFRDWVHDSKRFGRDACAAYNRAQQAADAIGTAGPDTIAAAEGVLRGLVAALNAIDDKYGMIDTLRREQAWDGYCHLVKQLEVPMELADQWFDDDRHW